MKSFSPTCVLGRHQSKGSGCLGPPAKQPAPTPSVAAKSPGSKHLEGSPLASLRCCLKTPPLHSGSHKESSRSSAVSHVSPTRCHTEPCEQLRPGPAPRVGEEGAGGTDPLLSYPPPPSLQKEDHFSSASSGFYLAAQQGLGRRRVPKGPTKSTPTAVVHSNDVSPSAVALPLYHGAQSSQSQQKEKSRWAQNRDCYSGKGRSW